MYYCTSGFTCQHESIMPTNISDSSTSFDIDHLPGLPTRRRAMFEYGQGLLTARKGSVATSEMLNDYNLFTLSIYRYYFWQIVVCDAAIKPHKTTQADMHKPAAKHAGDFQPWETLF